MSTPDDSAHPHDGAVLGRLVLTSDFDAPSAARRFVRDALAAVGRTALEADGALVVSELVTNVVVHTACPELTVTVELTPAGVSIAVEDCNIAPVTIEASADLGQARRGLRLIDAVSECWASEATSHGKRVWVELADP